MGGNIVATPRYDRLVRMVEEGREEGRVEGVSIGEANERMRTVCRMFSRDKCLALVSDATDFSMNELKEFEKQYKTDPKAFLTKYGYGGDSVGAQR